MHDIYLVDVVQFFLDGLKQRSKYAVCTADYEAPGRQTTADCRLQYCDPGCGGCCRSGRGPAEGGPGEAGAGQHGGHSDQDGVVQRSVDTRHLPCVVPYPLFSTQGPTRGINKRETSRWTHCTLFRRCLSHLRTYWWDIRTFTRDIHLTLGPIPRLPSRRRRP